MAVLHGHFVTVGCNDNWPFLHRNHRKFFLNDINPIKKQKFLKCKSWGSFSFENGLVLDLKSVIGLYF